MGARESSELRRVEGQVCTIESVAMGNMATLSPALPMLSRGHFQAVGSIEVVPFVDGYIFW